MRASVKARSAAGLLGLSPGMASGKGGMAGGVHPSARVYPTGNRTTGDYLGVLEETILEEATKSEGWCRCLFNLPRYSTMSLHLLSEAVVCTGQVEVAY